MHFISMESSKSLLQLSFVPDFHLSSFSTRNSSINRIYPKSSSVYYFVHNLSSRDPINLKFMPKFSQLNKEHFIFFPFFQKTFITFSKLSMNIKHHFSLHFHKSVCLYPLYSSITPRLLVQKS